MEQIDLRVTKILAERLETEARTMDRAAHHQAEADGRPAPRRKTSIEQAAAAILQAEFDRRDREAAKLRQWRRDRKARQEEQAA